MNTYTEENHYIKAELRRIIRTQTDGLEKAVAEEVLEYDDPATFFTHITNFGCVSDMVNSLINYADTHEFYEAHYEEIEEMRQNCELALGQPFQIQGDLKSFMTWFAFEETALQLAIELSLFS